MSLDEDVLRDVEAARCTLEALEDQAYEARAAFHQAIRRLHASGGSMREIATALGMSHQRVHQIIGTEGIVEVEASAVTEVSSLPVAATVTTGEDACSFCGAPRREVDKLLAGPGPVFVCGSCVQQAADAVTGKSTGGTLRVVPVDADATCSFCGNPSAIGGVMAEAADGHPRMCAQCTATCERLLVGGGEDKADRPAMRRNVRLRCSFCNISANDTKRLIAGPGVYICEGCVAASRSVIDRAQPAKGPRQVVLRPAGGEDHPCSFCETAPVASGRAIAKGGRGRICEACVGLCEDIIAADQ